jgi:hypothetical protein
MSAQVQASKTALYRELTSYIELDALRPRRLSRVSTNGPDRRGMCWKARPWTGNRPRLFQTWIRPS